MKQKDDAKQLKMTAAMHGIKIDEPEPLFKKENKNEMNKKAAQQVKALFGFANA